LPLRPAPAVAEDTLRAGASPAYANPVDHGDFPDPSILAVGVVLGGREAVDDATFADLDLQ
jgi:hypothetical protein